MNTTCLNPSDLGRYLREKLGEAEEARVESHIGTCTACQQSLERAAGGPDLWKGLSEGFSNDRAGADAPASPDVPDSLEASLDELREHLAPTDDPAMLGRLGHYEICGLIGRGSTGFVLKALEPRLNRYVAIKLMSPEYKSRGVARKRFEREGRAVAAISHEHVVPIHSVDEYRGLPYIVMQFIPGGSLQQRVENEGPLDTCEVTRIGLQVAKALDAAHAQGIVHRDVKPANVVLENMVDRAMVTDFGLAQIADEVAMTRSGTIAGTPQYMSPEQAKGEAIDPRSDLFSLGSLMYFACTGRAPFHAQTVFGVIHRVCESQPRPIREINPGISAGLAAFIEKLMAKRPEDRFPSANAVAGALSSELAYLQNPTAVAKPLREWGAASNAGGLRSWLVGSAVAGTAAVALAGFAFFGRDEAPTDSGTHGASLAALLRIDGAGTESDSLFEGTQVSWSRSMAGSEEEPTITFEQVLEQTLPVVPGEKLVVRVDRGNIQVVPSETEDLSIRVIRSVTAADLDEAEQLIGEHEIALAYEIGALELDGFFRVGAPETSSHTGFGEVLYCVAVPSGFHADVTTLIGDVAVGPVIGNVQVTTGAGSVALAYIDGAVDVTAKGGDVDLSGGCSGSVEILAILGDVDVAGVLGKARVRTSGGDVRLGGSSGEVDVQTEGGVVEIGAIAGPTFVHVSHGNIHLRLEEDPQQISWLSAEDGHVAILLDAEVAAEIMVRGDLETSLPSELLDAEDGSGAPWSVCRLNGGGAKIRVTCPSGGVSLASFEHGSSTEEDASLGSSGLGGSGLGGSGLGGSGRQGSGSALERTQGEPRPGALVSVALEDSSSAMDGYTLYLPISHATQEGTYPVLVYLQGSYGVGGEIGDINNWGLPRLLRDETDLTSERNRLLLDNFIVVSPHIQGGQYYSHPTVVEGILEDIFAEYKADPSRVYLTGLSRGAHGAWGLAARLPGTFAAIAPVGGNTDGVDNFGDLSGTAIWISHNAGDPIASYSGALESSREVEERCDVEFLRIDTLDVPASRYLEHPHVFTTGRTDSHDAWTQLYSSVEFYKWLLGQALAG